MTISAELFSGSHSADSDRKCLLENIAFLAGEEHSAHPVCVSSVLTEFGVLVNDLLPHAKRQELRQYEYQMMGTRNDGKDLARVKLCVKFTQKMASYSLNVVDAASYASRALEEGERYESVAYWTAESLLVAAEGKANERGKIYDEAIAFLGTLIKGGE